MLGVVAVVLALAVPADTGGARAPAAPGDTGRAGGAWAGAGALADTASPEVQTVVRLQPGRFERALLAEPPSEAEAAAASAAAAMGVRSAGPLPADTPVRRPRAVAVDYSDWYARRLAVHRVASYAMLPLFVGQYVTGTQLMQKGASAPQWAIRLHGPLATADLMLFGVNTLTGGWNLWAARKDPEGRTPRMLHGILMLAADAGFATAGYLSKPAENSSSIRSLHRTIALSSVGVALVSYAIMLPPFRR